MSFFGGGGAVTDPETQGWADAKMKLFKNGATAKHERRRQFQYQAWTCDSSVRLDLQTRAVQWVRGRETTRFLVVQS